MVRAEWQIYEKEYWAITSTLEDLLRSSRAAHVLLIDRTGQLIAQVGERADFDHVSFASLCAADFEANYQLARLVGEDDFSTLYHQGTRESMYLGKMTRGVVLVVLFDRRTTLGLVRLRVKAAGSDLDRIVDALHERLQYRNEENDALDESFTREAEAEIDSLFVDSGSGPGSPAGGTRCR